jgi:hypothetical protein
VHLAIHVRGAIQLYFGKLASSQEWSRNLVLAFSDHRPNHGSRQGIALPIYSLLGAHLAVLPTVDMRFTTSNSVQAGLTRVQLQQGEQSISLHNSKFSQFTTRHVTGYIIIMRCSMFPCVCMCRHFIVVHYCF